MATKRLRQTRSEARETGLPRPSTESQLYLEKSGDEDESISSSDRKTTKTSYRHKNQKRPTKEVFIEQAAALPAGNVPYCASTVHAHTLQFLSGRTSLYS